MVKWLYINHILNNFTYKFCTSNFYYLYIYGFVLINFVISMAENVVVEPPRPEDDQENRESIPTVPTSGPTGK
jgi:hypothetical protein